MAAALFMPRKGVIGLKYYGYTKEQIERMIFLLNTISVTGLAQIDAYHEATTILRHPSEIDVPEKTQENTK